MLKQKLLVQFGSGVVTKILTVIGGIFVARYAGPETLGILAFGLAFVSVFSFILGFFTSPHIKILSETEEKGTAMATYLRLQTVSIGAYILLVSSWILFQKHVLNQPFSTKEHETVIWIFIFVIVFEKILEAVKLTYTALIKQVKANYPSLIRQLLYQIGRIAVAALGFQAVVFASWNLAALLLVMPFVIKLFMELEWGKWDKQMARKYYEYAKPLVLYAVVGIMIRQTDKLLLQYYANSIELGYYAAAYSLGGFILIFGNTIGQVFFPLFSGYISKNDWASVNDKVSTFQSIAVKFILPMVVVLVLISRPLITIVLGQTYEASVDPFRILILTSFFIILILPYQNIITGSGRFYLYARLTFYKFLFFSLSLYLLLSPDFLGMGATGNAINKLLVTLFEGALYLYFVKKIGSVKLSGEHFVVSVFITAIGVAAYLVIPYVQESSFWLWPVLVLVYLILSYGGMYLFRLIKKEDLELLLSVLNLKKLKQYISAELKEGKKD